MGTLSDDGYELGVSFGGEEVNATDAYGLTLVEAIYRGFNWKVRLTGLEWKTALVALLKEFGSTTGLLTDGLLTPQLLNVGTRWTTFAQALVLTAILGNPPTTPQSLTATNAAFAPNANSTFLLTSKVRQVPLDLVLIPYTTVINSVTVAVPFTVT